MSIPKEGTLAYAVLACIASYDVEEVSEAHPDANMSQIAKDLGEPINLVSGTLKHLLNKGHVYRDKDEDTGAYKYWLSSEVFKGVCKQLGFEV